MEIRKVETDKKRYLDLLLLADEQEDMVDRYLERGTMYVLEDNGVKAECVVTDEGGVLELKNLAVEPAFQGRGYGKAMVDFLVRTYRGQYTVLQAGHRGRPPPSSRRPAAFAGTIWSKTFSPNTTTTPSARAGYSWWIWCICKETCEKSGVPKHSAFC